MSELTVYACLCVECTGAGSNPVTSPIDSQLMSPHGMHHHNVTGILVSANLPTHVSARNASARCSGEPFCGALPTHVSARNASFLFWKRGTRSFLPTHVSARNASEAPSSPRFLQSSQLMSPHGMHLTNGNDELCRFASQLMSPHGMHQEGYKFRFDLSPPNSCLRTECIFSGVSVMSEKNFSQLMSPHGMHH